MKFLPNLTRKEMKYGLITMLVCMLLLPPVLSLALPGWSAGRLNFTAYFITAGAAVYVLRRYLLQNLKIAVSHPFYCVYYAVLSYLGYMVFTELVTNIVYTAAPGFVNLNNENVTAMLDSEFGLMAFTTVVLAPIAEECLFRGLLLRGVYDRSPVLAWVLSVGLFAAIHVTGFIRSYAPLELLLAFVQYLPAGIALCFAYRRGGSIFSPILTHAIVNSMAVLSVTR
ncbi:MAG: CPBP family intramembrane metalloprotease [Oscillospiraceae bacterium]|nr:CPBP family intramembrane metalloprotease [Oscillospiraceae bacterium]